MLRGQTGQRRLSHTLGGKMWGKQGADLRIPSPVAQDWNEIVLAHVLLEEPSEICLMFEGSKGGDCIVKIPAEST